MRQIGDGIACAQTHQQLANAVVPHFSGVMQRSHAHLETQFRHSFVREWMMYGYKGVSGLYAVCYVAVWMHTGDASTHAWMYFVWQQNA